jgi:hypothetical protein
MRQRDARVATFVLPCNSATLVEHDHVIAICVRNSGPRQCLRTKALREGIESLRPDGRREHCGPISHVSARTLFPRHCCAHTEQQHRSCRKGAHQRSDVLSRDGWYSLGLAQFFLPIEFVAHSRISHELLELRERYLAVQALRKVCATGDVIDIISDIVQKLRKGVVGQMFVDHLRDECLKTLCGTNRLAKTPSLSMLRGPVFASAPEIEFSWQGAPHDPVLVRPY